MVGCGGKRRYLGAMTVLRLFPAPQQTQPLPGSYLDFRLHKRATHGDVLVYANYIASLDGRIALPDLHGEQGVPASLANPRDWRLYQELAAQSDIMLTSARYFRQLAKGNAQDLLPVGAGGDYADLRDWRRAEGLPAQPDVAIISASLDIPQAALAKVQDRRVLVLTTAASDTEKIARLEGLGVQVIIAGERRVEGELLKRALV
ncbi:MAG: dihydrofolate reductase family protein, partial [Mariprofundaceae bacterium]|nr:dihydrofolate reductase family protein [Mariprofundaceae bacterium]